MGRALLIIVAALSLAGLTYGLTQQTTRGETAAREVNVQHDALAQSAARGGFDAALHALLDDLDTRPAVADRATSAEGGYGHYDVRSADTAVGSVRLTAEGRYASAGYVVEADVIEVLALGAPVVIDARKAKASFRDDAYVSGLDRRVPGTQGGSGGPAGAMPAVLFRDAALRAEVTDDWDADDLAALEGRGPTAVGMPPAAVAELVQAALADAATTTVSELELGGRTLGTPLAPVAVHVSGDATIDEDGLGYGLLVVDGDFAMKENGQWEGLVVVRAEAGQKRKVELKDEAALYGSLVLLGSEFLEESSGGSGFPGGHMDLDLFSGSGAPLDRDYHQHEWDDRYDLTSLDFFGGPDIGPEFSAFHADNIAKSIRVQFVNANNAAGTYEIGAATGRIEDGFDAVVPFASLSRLLIAFDGLCSLRGTSPGRVKSATGSRDGAFTVRFWDGPTLVYAVSAYEHAKLLRDGDASCASGSGSTEQSEAYGEFELKLQNDASLLYSEEAIGRVGRGVAAVRDQSRGFPVFLRSVSVPR